MTAPPVREREDATVRNRHRDRYELVFLLLVSTFVLAAFGVQARGRLPLLLLYAAALVLALRSSRLSGFVARGLRVVLAAGTIGVGAAALAAPGNLTEGIVSCWIALVLATTIVLVVRRILRHRIVTGQTIFGALSAYLMIGFFFSAVFTAMDRLDSEPFFAGGQAATSATVQYFSFVTLSTTGYGDYTAAGEAGRWPCWRRCSGRSSWSRSSPGWSRCSGRPGRTGRGNAPAGASLRGRPPATDRTVLTRPSSGSASARAARGRARSARRSPARRPR
jgi:hypothetical protein